MTEQSPRPGRLRGRAGDAENRVAALKQPLGSRVHHPLGEGTHVTVTGTAGTPTIDAYRDSADGTLVETNWSATFGDFSQANYTVQPAAGSIVSPNPTLGLWIDDTTPVPPTGKYSFAVFATADGSGPPVATSSNQPGAWNVPTSVLQDGQTYYWQVNVSASVDGTSSSLMSALSPFTVDSALNSSQDPAANAGNENISSDDGSTAQDTALTGSQYVDPTPEDPELPWTGAESTAPQTRQAATTNAPSIQCNRKYVFTGTYATWSQRHACGGHTVNWGFQASVSFCNTAIGLAHETGLTYTVYGKKGVQSNSSHTEGCRYFFHGTMNPVHDGDTVTDYDQITVRKPRGTGYAYTYGSFHQTSSNYHH